MEKDTARRGKENPKIQMLLRAREGRDRAGGATHKGIEENQEAWKTKETGAE